jgi:hypothetical protein
MFQADADAALEAAGTIGDVEDDSTGSIEQDLKDQDTIPQAETIAEATVIEDVQVSAEAIDDNAAEKDPEEERVLEEKEPLSPLSSVEADSEEVELLDGSDVSTDKELDAPLVMEVQCVTCGKYRDKDELFMDIGGLSYCAKCGPQEENKLSTSVLGAGGEAATIAMSEESPVESEQTGNQPARFTIGGVIREAWGLTSGVKGPIWGGLLVTYGLIFVLGFGYGIWMALSGQYNEEVLGVVFQIALSVLSTILTGGLMFMGVKRGMGRRVVWKDVFSGFKVSGKIVIAAILQMVLILVGCLLFLLPGIYLMIGYFLTLPLIIDKKMSPWQAMETSRKAIHKVWWKICGLYFVVGLIITVSAIPLGIGLLWTIPMSVVLVGVVYKYLFTAEKKS